MYVNEYESGPFVVGRTHCRSISEQVVLDTASGNMGLGGGGTWGAAALWVPGRVSFSLALNPKTLKSFQLGPKP